MSDDLEFIVIDDIPEYIFCIGDDEENEQVIAISGKDGAFKYEKVDELPTAGEDGVLYLVPKSHTTQTASGNPISVNITDNAGKIESLKLDGDTFQQSYTGKNLYNIEAIPYVWRRAYSSTGEELSWTGYVGTDAYQPVEPNTAYALRNNKIGNTTYLCEYDENKNFIQRLIAVSQFTTTATTKYLRWSLSVGDGEIPPTQTQLELGSTATAYEPYVGGRPSPNPSYPQDINVVTGTQTISINGTNYPISLGSLELCKLGTYQDYIYKDGESWKVHKGLGKHIFDGSESFTSDGSYEAIYQYRWTDSSVLNTADQDLVGVKSDKFIGIAYTGSWTRNFSVALRYNYSALRFMTSLSTTIDDFKTWLASNNTTAYYALATPTDTTITDQTLIAQLEAVRTAALSTGSNTISNTATGTNLAGDLEIGYYGYDPLNKYDKYFWLDIDGGYESL